MSLKDKIIYRIFFGLLWIMFFGVRLFYQGKVQA